MVKSPRQSSDLRKESLKFLLTKSLSRFFTNPQHQVLLWLRIEEIVHLFADAINMDNETGMLIDWEWVESESVSIRSWPLIEKHVCISSFSVVMLSAPFASHQKWESHRNHLGITWDLLLTPPSNSCPRILFSCNNVLCTSHSKDSERRLKAGACFNLSSAKLLNLELAVAV